MIIPQDLSIAQVIGMQDLPTWQVLQGQPKEINEHVTQKRKLVKKAVFPRLGEGRFAILSYSSFNALRHVLSMSTLSKNT